MEITAALAAELGILTEALDDPGADITETVRQFGVYASLAVASYLGLTVRVSGVDIDFAFTTMQDLDGPGGAVSSVRMPLSAAGFGAATPEVEMILFASVSGAFVDLAADLSWLTGLELTAFALDQHMGELPGPAPSAALERQSVINQAIGMLIGRGYTPELAHRELDARAADTGTDRYASASLILATSPTTSLD